MSHVQQDLTQFLHYLQNTLEYQQQAIRKLEEDVKRLKEELTEAKHQAPIRVDRIEYKFDQLKVERLEGTLNIGLTPSDLEKIDELAINNHTPPGPFLFPSRDEFVHQLTSEVLLDLNNQKDEIFKRAEHICEQKADETMRSFIMEDLARQLPQRIHHYLDQTPPHNRTEQKIPAIREQISEVLKTDIENAIIRFIEVYPDSMKEQ
jgi:spore germination protein PC